MRGDGRGRRAGLGLAHRPHGAQPRHRTGALLRVRRGHAVGGRRVHVGLRRGHHRVLEPRHLVAVHLWDLGGVHAVVLGVGELLLHQGVGAVGPAVHVSVTVQSLAHRHGVVHRVAPRRQETTGQRILVFFQQGLGFLRGLYL